MLDTVEDIERQIQKLIQRKKLVSNALNLVGELEDSSQSTVGKTQTTSSKQVSSPRGKHKSSESYILHPSFVHVFIQSCAYRR